MRDFLTALGLALVMEGLAYAAFPQAMTRMLAQLLAFPPHFLRLMGIALAMIGLAGIWFARKAILTP